EKILGMVLAVGVFQDMDWKEVQKLVSFCGFDLVQLHGREDPAFCARFPGKVIKAFGVDENFQGEMVKEYRGVVRYILFDTKRGKSQGGTGEVFPWVKVKELARGEIPVIMAGGLGEENLRELLSLFHPFGVDLNSKVEERPGKKDLKKIQRIIIQLKGR
ncbi:MAG: phosphoribosylanthranilate isomerase, partial [Candidatus Caldatribacteriaceae bacterium]